MRSNLDLVLERLPVDLEAPRAGRPEAAAPLGRAAARRTLPRAAVAATGRSRR
jgi:hypothetical protein